MIARTWHGTVPADKADAYHDYLMVTGVPDLQQTPGNRGVTIFRRLDGAVAHFLLTSYWDSFEAIRRFAGDDVDCARYYAADAEFLLEREPQVAHYEVLDPPGLP